MAAAAQSDQVLFRVVARAAPELLMLNFQMRPRAAVLTSPAVPLQDGPMPFATILSVILQPWCGVLGLVAYAKPLRVR